MAAIKSWSRCSYQIVMGRLHSGHDETSRMILDRGCSLDVADLDGDTALHLAVRKQNNEIVAVLLRKGANPDLKNSSGECPLHEAIRNGLIPTAQLLLRGGCEVNIPGDFFLKKDSRSFLS